MPYIGVTELARCLLFRSLCLVGPTDPAAVFTLSLLAVSCFARCALAARLALHSASVFTLSLLAVFHFAHCALVARLTLPAAAVFTLSLLAVSWFAHCALAEPAACFCFNAALSLVHRRYLAGLT